MYRYTSSGSTLVLAFVLSSTFWSAVRADCPPAQIGTEACPAFTAPATTAVPGPSVGGTIVANVGLTTLFNGAVPPNGFMVQMNAIQQISDSCWVSDAAPASGTGPRSGFMIGGIWINTPLPTMFITPPGYKPMGPVTVWCGGAYNLEVRGW